MKIKSQEPFEKLEGAAREAQGMDGKASATRSPAAGCKEPTTPPAALEPHARRVALISARDGVARRSKITAYILPPRALSQAKIISNATPSSFSTGSLITFLLSAVFWLALASSAKADDFKVVSDRGEWKVQNPSKLHNVSVTFEWTDLAFNRLEHATLVVPPKGEVRICPVNGNTQPEPVKKR